MAADNVSGAKAPSQGTGLTEEQRKAVWAVSPEELKKAQAKLDAEAKRSFDLHVLLIMQVDRVPRNTALFRAWAEGPKGLARRLSPVSADQGDGTQSPKP